MHRKRFCSVFAKDTRYGLLDCQNKFIHKSTKLLNDKESASGHFPNYPFSSIKRDIARWGNNVI